MGENLQRVYELRSKLVNQKICKEELDKFDAMLHSYERKMGDPEKNDLSDAQLNDFYRIFDSRN